MGLGAGAAAGFALGCRARSASGRTAVKLQTDWYPQPEHGGFYTALVKGYYSGEGLEVEIVPGGPYVSGDGLVASGSVQFGLNSSDHILEAVSNSAEPLVAVGATMQHDPQGILVRADSPVKTWTDLEGKTVAVKPGSTWWEFIKKKFGLKNVREVPATYSVANFLQDPGYMQQAFVTSEPFFAEKAGVKTRMLLNRDAGYDPYRVFYTSAGFLKENPKAVGGFVRASVKGWREYLQDPTAAHAVILKLNPALNPEWMAYSYAALKSGGFVTGGDASGAKVGQFDAGRWVTMYQQLLDLKVIEKAMEPGKAYTMEFLG